MSQKILHITRPPIGEGRERVCYIHPDDEGKLIKIQKGDCDKQTRRELKLYRRLSRRKNTDYSQIPCFYGRVQTNLGPGFITDVIRDYDGNISNSLYWFFERGHPMEEFMPYLEELKKYLLDNQIGFNVDLTRSNVLFQKLSPLKAQLVVIDGFGNHSAINWFDVFKTVTDSKINRRWERFIKGLKIRSDKMVLDYGSPAKPLEDSYRRTR